MKLSFRRFQVWIRPTIATRRRAAGFGAALALTVLSAEARSFRVNMLPNGSTFSCLTCHVSSGGPRNDFGRAVGAITGSSTRAFWTSALAQQDSDGDGFSNGAELGDPDGDGAPIAGAQVTNPGDAASKPTPPSINLSKPVLLPGGSAAELTWTGGGGTYLIQKKYRLNDVLWRNVLTTTEPKAWLALEGDTGVFRVQNNAATTVIPLTVWLSGDAFNPPVATTGRGFGSLALEGNQLTYRIPYSGLSSAAFAAHIHGPALSTESADVLVPLAGAAGTDGELEGTANLSDVDKQRLLTGKTYVVIHTANHESGEVRGQLGPMRFLASLSGGAQVPPVTTTGSGTASFQLIGNQLHWTITYQNLSANATVSHIHGPATPTENSGPLVTLPGATGLSGTLTGQATLAPSTLGYLIDGRTYVNIHTTAHADGEVRGQIQPAP